MIKKLFLVALALGATLHNAAAKDISFSNKDQLNDPSSGVVVGEISWSQSTKSESGLKEPVQDVILRIVDANGAEYSIRMKFDKAALLFGSMAKSAREGRSESYVYKLPSGAYKVKDVWIITQGNKYRLPEEISIPFEVYPGKASYFGSVHIDVVSRKFITGFTHTAGVNISLFDDSASFLPSLLKKYSNIPVEKIVVIPSNFPMRWNYESLIIGD